MSPRLPARHHARNLVRLVAAGALLLVLAGCAVEPLGDAETVYVRPVYPHPYYYYPYPRHYWVPGHWTWNGYYVPGYWR